MNRKMKKMIFGLKELKKWDKMREDGINKLEVHVAGVCLRKKDDQWQVLVAKRSPNRQLYPNMWECGGGQLNPGENFIDGLKRQMKEELGVIINNPREFKVYEINLSQKKIPGVRFICDIEKYVNGKEPQVDGKELIEWKWLNISEIDKFDIIPSLKEDLKQIAKNL